MVVQMKNNKKIKTLIDIFDEIIDVGYEGDDAQVILDGICNMLTCNSKPKRRCEDCPFNNLENLSMTIFHLSKAVTDGK